MNRGIVVTWICALYSKKKATLAKEMTYWDSFKDMTDGLLYDMKDYYMGNK